MRHLLICDDTQPEAVADLCRQYGYGIEVQAFYHPNALSDPTRVEHTAKLITGIPLVGLHGPFGDLNPGSFDPLVRELARQRIQKGYEIGMRLGAEHMVFHHGRVPKTNPESSWIKTSAEFWKAFLDQVPPHVHIHLENMLEAGPQVLCGILDEVDHPNLHANLDIGHAYCNSTTPVIDWIEALQRGIGYVHLHDNHGEGDEHLGLGRGTIPLKEVCCALEEYTPDALWAVEAEGEGVLQSIEWLVANEFIERRDTSGDR